MLSPTRKTLHFVNDQWTLEDANCLSSIFNGLPVAHHLQFEHWMDAAPAETLPTLLLDVRYYRGRAHCRRSAGSLPVEFAAWTVRHVSKLFPLNEHFMSCHWSKSTLLIIWCPQMAGFSIRESIVFAGSARLWKAGEHSLVTRIWFQATDGCNGYFPGDDLLLVKRFYKFLRIAVFNWPNLVCAHRVSL